MSDRLRGLVRPELLAEHAYGVPGAHAPIRLDANESAWPLSDRGRDLLQAAFRKIEAHRYPDPNATALREIVADRFHARAEEVVFGSGSDELIALLSTALSAPRAGRSRATILIPTPTFVMYAITARAHGLQSVEVPLNAEFDLDAGAMEAAIHEHAPHLVYFATPNNPTGNAYREDVMRALIADHPDTLFVIDEAYAAFQGKSLSSWFDAFPNVAIMGTLSKIGFAAARVGWIRLPHSLAVELNKARQPFNLNAYSQAVGELAFTQLADEIQANVAVCMRERTRVYEAMHSMAGIRVHPSSANFHFAYSTRNADDVRATLLKSGISVRSFQKHGGRLANALRISVGTPDENTQLLAALPAALVEPR